MRTPPVPSDTAPTDDQQGVSSSFALIKTRLKKARREGFSVSQHDVVIESISAAVAASGRPKFAKLMSMLGPQTGLVVWTLDELGRDAADVLRTVQKVTDRGADVYCLEVSDDELTLDRRIMATLKAVTDLDRTAAKARGLAEERGKGVAGGRVGRPASLDDDTQSKVRTSLATGEKVTELARRYNTSRQTIMRIRNASK